MAREALEGSRLANTARGIEIEITFGPADPIGLLATITLFTAGALFGYLAESCQSAGREGQHELQSTIGTIITAVVTLMK